MLSLAAEGGYQVFRLAGGEWFWLVFSAATAVLALARRWQRRTGAEVRVAHAAATGPGLAAMVAQLRAGGAHRVDVAPWFLAPGRLLDATRAAAHLAGADTVAAPLGDAPAVIEAVLHRFDAGLSSIQTAATPAWAMAPMT